MWEFNHGWGGIRDRVRAHLDVEILLSLWLYRPDSVVVCNLCRRGATFTTMECSMYSVP